MAASSSNKSGAPGRAPASMELEKASDAIWGARSLLERFGHLSGRQLQEKIFSLYEAGRELTQLQLLLYYSQVRVASALLS